MPRNSHLDAGLLVLIAAVPIFARAAQCAQAQGTGPAVYLVDDAAPLRITLADGKSTIAIPPGFVKGTPGMTLPPSPTFQQSEDDYTGPNGQKLTIRVIDLSREPNIAQSNLDSVFTPEEFALIKQQSQATSKPILDPLPYPDRFFVAGFLTATKWLHNVKVAKLGPITGVVSETDTPGGTGYFFEGEKGNRIYTVLGSGMGADDVKAVAGSLVPQ